MKRALATIPNTFDKREGSILYDAFAPAALELSKMYIELELVMRETFADTASREYLIRRAAERGIAPESATRAIGRGEFNLDIPIGSRFSLDKFNYIATEQLAEGAYKMECETPGREANGYTGKLIPIQYIQGLQKAELTEILIPGEEEEETEEFRKRYFTSLKSEAFGGNKRDYEEKATSIPGVGGVKIYPVWNGGGTVKLVVVNSEYQKPAKELIEEIQTKFDPVENQGKGLGLAPIGHVVTVEGAEESLIEIGLSIIYQTGWNWQKIKEKAESTIDNYFLELNQKWAQTEAVVVRISQIETRLLDLDGVLDVSHTKLNGIEENLVLPENCIAKRGEVHE